MQLATSLQGVVTQQLIPRASGSGRVLCSEVLVPNPAIRNLIREDKLHQVYSQMQIGQAKFGMQTMNQSLCDLYMRKLITLDQCLGHSSEVDELKTMIQNQGGSLAGVTPPSNTPALLTRISTPHPNAFFRSPSFVTSSFSTTSFTPRSAA